MVVAEGTVVAATPELTQRERQVLLGIAQGLTNKQIAERLGVGIRTVETHRQNIMEKLGIHTVAGLTRYAVAKGLLPSEARPSQNNASPSG
jgi:DNA-binding NarL/FixJ family response regulator